MFIVDQERNLVVNMDNATIIYPCGKRILAGATTGREYTIGDYKTKDRADEVFAEMLKEAFSPAWMALKNRDIDAPELERMEQMATGEICIKGKEPDVSTVKRDIYYMPEE